MPDTHHRFRYHLTARLRFTGICLVMLSGCIAGPAPRLAPEGPIRQVREKAVSVHWYDMNGDGTAEYGEGFDADGRIDRLYYDHDQDGTWDELINLNEVPPAQHRHLVILLDSIPFDMVAAAREEGSFRYFPPPTRVIAPFPVMTDLCFCEFFGCTPTPGVESEYYDGKRLTSGYSVYASGANAPWLAFVDYWLSPVQHPAAYLDSRPWFDHELRRIQEVYRQRQSPSTVGYVVSTSALGARIGREGHEHGLRRLERYCRRMVYESRGRIRLTLMSDHGHHLEEAHRIALDDEMRARGYRIGVTLNGSIDAVVPEFGMVSYAGIYTHKPATIARDILDVEGVDVVAFMGGDGRVRVLARDGEARIEPAPQGYRYLPERGDPLKLSEVLNLSDTGGSDTGNGRPREGVLTDHDALRLATTQTYPDVLHRLWRAFHGLVEHPPDVMVSLEDGYYCGSGTMSSLVRIVGVHGNLKPDSTFGFALTMQGPLPETIRMEDLHEAMTALDVPLQKTPAAR